MCGTKFAMVVFQIGAREISFLISYALLYIPSSSSRQAKIYIFITSLSFESTQ